MLNINKNIKFVEKYNKDTAETFAQQLGISSFVVGVLLNHGLQTLEEIREFIYGKEQPYHDAFLMKDMTKAVERIEKAIVQQELITIYGDYDVDGITASSLLYLTLRDLSARVNVYIPKRECEGYGLNKEALEKLYSEGTSLIITVDCGISGVQEVCEMPEAMDIIITDHHTPPDILPAAYAVINPHQIGCRYPFKELAGVGVAFKLCQGLLKNKFPSANFIEERLEFVALGTVADIVDLRGENRELVRRGLKKFKGTKRLGLIELMKVAGCYDKTITSEIIGFGLAPRLNAAGRLEHAMSAVNLLITENQSEAEVLAKRLNDENIKRQEISSRIFKEAEELLRKQKTIEHAIVLASKEWHAGVIGIVASRLVEKYHLPAILLSIDGEKAKGSCRSIPALNLYETIKKCDDLLLQYGGHHQAAGLTLLENKVEEFAHKFKQIVAAQLEPGDYTVVVEPDIIITQDAKIDKKLLQEISLLEPFGANNPAPIFAFKNARLNSPSVMGMERNHLRFCVENGCMKYKGIMWNKGQYLQCLYNGCVADIAFNPKINVWNGNENIDLQIIGLNIQKKVVDYRNNSDSKEMVLKNILQNGKKTVIYGNSKSKLFNLYADICEFVTYGSNLRENDFEQVVFWDLPLIDLWSKAMLPFPFKREAVLYLLYNQNDYIEVNQHLLNLYPNRLVLIEAYKKLIDILKRQSVANKKDLLDNTNKDDIVLTENILQIFFELGFINIEQGQISLRAHKKNELSNSKTFCLLQAEYNEKITLCHRNMQTSALQIADIWQ